MLALQVCPSILKFLRDILGPFHFHMNFRIIVSQFIQKMSARILIRNMSVQYYRSIWRIFNILALLSLLTHTEGCFVYLDFLNFYQQCFIIFSMQDYHFFIFSKYFKYVEFIIHSFTFKFQVLIAYCQYIEIQLNFYIAILYSENFPNFLIGSGSLLMDSK